MRMKSTTAGALAMGEHFKRPRRNSRWFTVRPSLRRGKVSASVGLKPSSRCAFEKVIDIDPSREVLIEDVAKKVRNPNDPAKPFDVLPDGTASPATVAVVNEISERHARLSPAEQLAALGIEIGGVP